MSNLISGLSFEVLKEPRGFIKILELVLAIFAFATCSGYSETGQCQQYCSGVKVEYSFSVDYPFKLIDSTSFPTGVGSCNQSSSKRSLANINPTSQAGFYVFVGVMVFLYCIGSLAGYLLFDETYRSNPRWPLLDLIVTAIIVLFWLIGASVFAQCVGILKHFTNQDFMIQQLKDALDWPCLDTNACWCSAINYSSLDVSIVFGFLNLLVWAGNGWFIYKETPYFQSRQEGGDGTGIEGATDAGGVGVYSGASHTPSGNNYPPPKDNFPPAPGAGLPSSIPPPRPQHQPYNAPQY